MPTAPPTIRVVVRLPYNRPDEPLPNPPRVEWNSEKEQILWEVIAKSRAMEGAGTDWKGLAAHLQVPLPYLLYRAQTRYEADLRGLQGIRGPIATSPNGQLPVNSTSGPTITPTKVVPANANVGEYFPRFPNIDSPVISRKDSLRTGGGNMALSATGRPLGVRARLNSLGGQSQVRSRRFNSTSSHTTKKVSSSSTLTLQGPRKTPRPVIRTLSPSRGSPSGLASPNDASSEDESDEEERDKEEEEERQLEEQNVLDKKLKDLQRMMTKEALGLISSPTPPRPFPPRNQTDKTRTRPLSVSSASSSFHQKGLDLSRRYSANTSQSHTPSHQSLSSASSPQGSIPSIPTPPPETRNQPLAAGRMARHLSPQGKSTSPPTVSPRSAWGQTVRQNSGHVVARTKVGGERGSEMGSEASSFSDLSDASLSASALESALMSNIRGGGSRQSSFARSQLSGRRPSAR